QSSVTEYSAQNPPPNQHGTESRPNNRREQPREQQDTVSPDFMRPRQPRLQQRQIPQIPPPAQAEQISQHRERPNGDIEDEVEGHASQHRQRCAQSIPGPESVGADQAAGGVTDAGDQPDDRVPAESNWSERNPELRVQRRSQTAVALECFVSHCLRGL